MVVGVIFKIIVICVVYLYGKYCLFLIVYVGESNFFVIYVLLINFYFYILEVVRIRFREEGIKYRFFF